MPRKRKSEPIGIGYTAKQMRKKKPINNEYLVDITPLTDNQKVLFDSYNQQKNIVAYGVAGTGKTFITLFNALKDVLDETKTYLTIFTNTSYDTIQFMKIKILKFINYDDCIIKGCSPYKRCTPKFYSFL